MSGDSAGLSAVPSASYRQRPLPGITNEQPTLGIARELSQSFLGRLPMAVNPGTNAVADRYVVPLFWSTFNELKTRVLRTHVWVSIAVSLAAPRVLRPILLS